MTGRFNIPHFTLMPNANPETIGVITETYHRPEIVAPFKRSSTTSISHLHAEVAPVPLKIQFNRDVRPILSENCFACHGPDKNKRKAELRLDMAEGGAFVDHKGHFPLVAGKVDQSELFRRITSKKSDELMPPPDSDKKLSARQKEILRRWIEQGAVWQPLWSFMPPQRPELPEVKDASWCRNPIDRFILARLESEHLAPSSEADKATLVRRLYLDLLGLPPTPVQVDEFLSDKSPDAYERLVDRLLANPHYGERMALEWLDAARFADTHGYHIDAGRDMTAWCEWVIDAFNRDLPYDQFTTKQLAGDLLPNATLDDKIASGFCRNNMINFEGGAIPEEYHAAYIIDRVNTMGTVWLGLTVGCCQCHDHKFDPIAQKEYYQLFAFFNHVPENGLDGQKGNAAPFIKTPTPQQRQKLDELATAIQKSEADLLAPSKELDAAQAEWENHDGSKTDQPIAWTSLEPSSMKSAGARRSPPRTTNRSWFPGQIQSPTAIRSSRRRIFPPSPPFVSRRCRTSIWMARAPADPRTATSC